MALPEKYGNWRGVYDQLRMQAIDGTCERVLTALMAQADADEDLHWADSVDMPSRTPTAVRGGTFSVVWDDGGGTDIRRSTGPGLGHPEANRPLPDGE
ncbi:hypothetical protein [Streptomyces olivaceoviridis]|uniref:hypothetical protein n=1 Tax=Streptomyces olivaceoviridis TaxID=1921 RepID=UPI0036F95DE8